MSELQIIQEALKRTARRRRFHRGWNGMWRGVLLAASIWLLAVACYKFLPLSDQILTVTAATCAALVLIGTAAGAWRRSSLQQTARWVDDRHRFQERLSTALELSQNSNPSEWRELILTDAAERAKSYDPRGALPLVLPRLARWTLLVLALAAGLGFVPEYRSKAHLQKKKDVELIKESGRQLTELTKRQLENRPPALENTRKALESVNELGQQMAKLQLNRQEALKELASASDRIKEQLRELGRNPGLRKLEQASRTGPAANASTPEALQKQIESMQEQLGRQAGQADALEKMKQDLQNIREAAAGLQTADGASAEQMKSQMAQAMADLAKQAEQMGLDLAGLDEAVKALQNGDIDRLMKDLDVATLDLEKMAQMARAMKDLQKQLAEWGKTLAEQLDKGQGLPAIATLQKMIRQLKEANLTPDQLKQMLAEINEAVKPGSEYGKVGEFLKNAANQLAQNQKNDASNSLAMAAEEIKKLMQQAGDSEGMLASLEALRMAQMCVGNGMSWGLCRGTGCRPGLRPGKPGRGVGTWGDDSLFMDPEDSGLWDNSGIERPDMDARGLTDRGEGTLNPALNPTKVRGQISPGGPMPSITLRGVSIKGTSKVEYEERVTTAQSEAQSALNQDQVPRAYRGAVRDYFDDLK